MKPKLHASAVTLAVFLLLAWGPPVARPAGLWAVVAVARANIRSGPGTGYPAIHAAELGERLEVLEEFGAWVRILLPREGQGWIYRELVVLEEEPAPAAPQRVTPAPAPR